MLASDPAIENADSLFNGQFIRAFVHELVEAKVLDGLSERDCDTFSMLAIINGAQGPAHLAWRIHQWLNGNQLDRNTDEDNPLAVCSALATALKIMIDAFAWAFAAAESKG
ncbi:hypothetical protein L841_0074 [Mycobacterium sp. MAC_080597_8934]|nr:hypothetical protein L840_2871 [Mycobacterium sp. MAC_011194_8550]ETZ75116.1 hypothetical protein L841_0074 [Mycobacterium sp. MAC_080597_8934]